MKIAIFPPKTKHFSSMQSVGASRKTIARLTVLTIGFAFFEGLGITLLLPILEFAENGFYDTSSPKGRLLSQLIHSLHVEDKRAVLAILLTGAFLLLAVRSLLQYARDIGAAGMIFRITGKLRKQAIEVFLHSSMTFITAHDRGELYNILTLESHRAAEAVASRIVFFNASVLLLLYLFLLFFFCPLLAVYTLPLFVGVGYVFRRQGILSTSFSASVYDKNRGFAERIVDCFHCLIRIKMRAQESMMSRKLAVDVQAIMDDLLKIERMRILVEIGIYPILVFAVFIILYIAIIQLDLSLAELGIFMFVMTRLVPQLTLMNSMWAHMHGCGASFQELISLLEKAGSQREISTGSIVFSKLNRGITFDQVSFRYPQGFSSLFELRNLNFFLPRGSISAIVGPSGAGKTTLVNLLASFYPYQAGEIRLDDVSLRDYRLSSLRQRIAYVSQEPLLFHDTIRDNINFGLGKPLSDHRIKEILQKAHCQDIVDGLDQGLDAVVGERGCLLSQGQRQRLSIAAGLAIEPEILILDEPTSALDSVSENAIQDTLKELKGKLTIIVIAHRFSTIVLADMVLLMDQGSLVHIGSHDHLLTVSRLYQTLFQTQILS